VEAVEYFCFHFQLRKKLVASGLASASNSFFKVLPLPQKFNRFRFHIPGLNSISECLHKSRS